MFVDPKHIRSAENVDENLNHSFSDELETFLRDIVDWESPNFQYELWYSKENENGPYYFGINIDRGENPRNFLLAKTADRASVEVMTLLFTRALEI